MRRLPIVTGLAVAAAMALVGTTAQANFHLWQVKEVFTNHDGTVQFIELVDNFNGEHLVSTHQLRATSDGVNKTFNITTNLPNPPQTAGRHMLFATPGFGALAGGRTPDYTLPDPVVNGPFFNPNATSLTITFVTVDSITFAGSLLPKDGVNSITDTTVYATPTFVVGTNSPTNFVTNMAGSVNVPPPPVTTGDYNGDLTVNAADYTVWRDTLGQTGLPLGSGADGDGDGMIDNGDYDFWKLRFGNVLGGTGAGATGSASASAVPEPTAIALVPMAFGGLALVFACCRNHRNRR